MPDSYITINSTGQPLGGPALSPPARSVTTGASDGGTSRGRAALGCLCGGHAWAGAVAGASPKSPQRDTMVKRKASRRSSDGQDRRGKGHALVACRTVIG